MNIDALGLRKSDHVRANVQGLVRGVYVEGVDLYVVGQPGHAYIPAWLIRDLDILHREPADQPPVGSVVFALGLRWHHIPTGSGSGLGWRTDARDADVVWRGWSDLGSASDIRVLYAAEPTP